MVKKKRPNTPLGDDSASNSVSGSAVPSPVTVTHDAAEEGKEDKKPPVFKHPNFQHSSKSSNKKRAWRSLKQIIAQERMLPWGDDYIHCKIQRPTDKVAVCQCRRVFNYTQFTNGHNSRIPFITQSK
ncbi:INO80 complex subunit C isoform X3 [Schistocerca cancellata]|uniref:INO80 complex subunit C isoform X3 n=1 Tax=Schistocerca cancellata TaxID=274614 RepID=UPI0021183F5F|nr:INO80 complex subunit C isoform X3 [Schistocerca cancellata]